MTTTTQADCKSERTQQSASTQASGIWEVPEVTQGAALGLKERRVSSLSTTDFYVPWSFDGLFKNNEQARRLNRTPVLDKISIRC